jgi:tRNA(Ile)-lysidine synthase
MMMAATPAATDLSAYLAQTLANAGLTSNASLAIAVSGGADSMALALLMAELYTHHTHLLTTLTVDHGLRTESQTEAKYVAKWMQQRGVTHSILTTAPIDAHRNLQAHARAARYDALLEYCAAHSIDTLLLAHHADDQAETVALQRHRGNTPPSRCGMALVRVERGIKLVRPLLGVRKTRLIDYLRNGQQPWLEDPSNQSTRHARNRVRDHMDDTTMHALWHEAQRMGKARHDQEQRRNQWIRAHITLDPTGGYHLPYQPWVTLPELEASDLLSHVIHIAGGKPFRPRFHETLRLIARITSQHHGTATLGHCQIRWDHQHNRILIRREAVRSTPLDTDASLPHMEQELALKRLEALPFWWFTAALNS